MKGTPNRLEFLNSISSMIDIQIQDKHMSDKSISDFSVNSPGANVSGENICGQELGEVVFETKLPGLFLTWNLRLAKSSKITSGNVRSSSIPEPLSEVHTSS
jgi:hypothetical protein